MRGRGLDAMLAAAATLTAAWPVSTLLAEPIWLGGTVLLLAVVAVSGIGARSLALRGWQVLIVQLLCVILTAGGIYGQGHLWHGLPTFETLGFARELIGEAMTTVQAYAAPAPTTPGLSFVVGCALALVALAVDYLAVTRRSPSLAGLPLLTAFLSSAANSGSSLPAFFFLAAAGMWLVLVARSGSAILRRWGTTVAVARTPVREPLDTQSVYGYASTARSLGVLALVIAVGLPIVLPQLPPKFILSGLGRSSSATGGGLVGFSLNLDVAADLRSQSTAPVLQYQTTDPSPPPLRVAVSSLYDSSRGAWVPRRETAPILSGKPDIPLPTGLSNDVPRKRFAMTFERNMLDRPNLAAPYPLVSANLHDVGWGLDEESQDVTVAERPDSYALSYWRLEPTAAMLQRAVAPSSSAEGSIEANLELDDRSFESVMEQSTRLTMGKTSAYDRAMAIQEHLRTSGGFTYSLDLAPPTRDQFGELSDPLTHFLTTKRGYCVQFATAMVMMSRAAGIPARMAIGFLPGTSSKGVWAVTASQAHTWPELYLDGIGWTRFEPTPSRGAPPVYAVPPTPGGVQGGGGRPVDETRTPAPAPSGQADLGDPSTGSGASSEAGLSLASVRDWLTHGWGLVLLGSLAGLLGALVVPTAARWRRRRELLAAKTSARRVEVQWELLMSSLADLGIAPMPSRTPRQLRTYYAREALLEGAASEALGRVMLTLERSRYAASAPVPEGLAADTRQVLRTAAANRRRGDRLRAALWPSSGLAQLRSASAELAWRVRAPLRDVSAVVRQRFPRRR